MNPSDNAYEVLGVPVDADLETITAAYREKAMATHPDIHGDEFRETYNRVLDAYQLLSDTDRRRAYDETQADRFLGETGASSDADGEDPYEILGVPHDAANDAIDAAFRERAMSTHPDIHGESSRPAYEQIQAAYGLLSDPAQRHVYDAKLADAGNIDQQAQPIQAADAEVPSAYERAAQMVNDGRPEEEITALLVQDGVDYATARLYVNDLIRTRVSNVRREATKNLLIAAGIWIALLLVLVFVDTHPILALALFLPLLMMLGDIYRSWKAGVGAPAVFGSIGVGLGGFRSIGAVLVSFEEQAIQKIRDGTADQFATANVRTSDLQPGDCIRTPGEEAGRVRLAMCSTRLLWNYRVEGFFTVDSRSPDYPDQSLIVVSAVEQCSTQTDDILFATREAWDAGSRRGICLRSQSSIPGR